MRESGSIHRITVLSGLLIATFVLPFNALDGEMATSLNIQGRLEAAGLITDPITFTSAADNAPGGWWGIFVSGSAYLNHAVVRYGSPNVGIGGAAGGQWNRRCDPGLSPGHDHWGRERGYHLSG